MRKNLAKHTAKKLPLAKRVLALCFALIFVCSCLLPAFANGTGAELETPDTEVVEAAAPGTDPEPMDLYDEPAAMDDQVEKPVVDDEPTAMDDQVEKPVVDDEPAAMDDQVEKPVVDDEPAAMDDQVEKPVVDDEPAAMDDQVEKPVEGDEPPVADDTPAEEGATKTTTDASGNIVYEYDTSGTTFPDDDAAALPDGDQMQVDAAFSIPTNIYHFWLKKMSSYDLADIADAAKTAEMTVEQYLAMYGTEKGCYHIMTAADGANLKDYQFANPTSNDDPEGNSRTFAGWYYTDELGDEQKFVFDECLYVSESTTVEVYAKWKDTDTEISAVADDEKTESDDKEQKEADEKAKYQKMFDDLVTADSLDKLMPLWDEYYASEEFDKLYEYVLTLGEEDQKAFEQLYQSITELQESEIALLDVDSEIHATNRWIDILTVGEQITLKCTSTHSSSSTFDWCIGSKDDTGVIKIVSNSDGTATITALKAGEVTVYHREKTRNGWYYYTDFKKIKVKNESYSDKIAYIYYLKSPIYSADRNDEAVWLPDSNPWEGKVNITGAIWETGPEYYYEKRSGTWEVKYNLNKNIYLIGLSDTQVTKYVKEWPDRSTGATWTLKRGDDYFNSVLKGIMADTSANGYRAKLAEDLGISESQIDENKIDEITMIPYKISHNHDSKNQDKYHIDCNVSVKSSQAYTAVFWVKQPGSEGYQKVFAKSYPLDKHGNAAKPVVKVTQSDIGGYILTGYRGEIDDTKKLNGVTYRFVGWYPENNVGTAHGNALITDDEWNEDKDGSHGYWPGQESDLSDGTVNFYAEYVPESMDVNITKTVTGLFGDRERNFTFAVTGTNENFELSNGENTKDKGITIKAEAGNTLTITESGVAGYTVSAVIVDKYGEKHIYPMKEDAASDTKTIDILVNMNMIVDDLVQIEVINNRDAQVDNGVLLDTLPYILILVVVVGGGVLLFLRKRKNDDDE